MVGTPPSPVIAGVEFSSSAIILLYPAVLRSGAQSVTADRNTRRNNGSNQYKGVRQQYITEY